MKKVSDVRGDHRIIWRTGKVGFEAIARELFDHPDLRTMVDIHIEKFFTRGWKKRLEERRLRHRSMGIPDSKFLHSDLRNNKK